MANEITAVVAASSTGIYALVRNPTNRAQAWDTDAEAWATYDRTDTDQQIALGSAIAVGAADEEQFADLPATLNSGVVYEYDVYDSGDELIGNGLTRLYTDASGRVASDLTAIAGNATNATNLGTAASNYSATRGLAGTALPAVAAGANGSLATTDANNRIAGVQGTINTLDQLDTAQDSQHAITRLDMLSVFADTVALSSVVATKTSGTEFTLDVFGAPANDDEINGKYIKVSDSVAVVADYVASTRTVTLDRSLDFSVANRVTVYPQDANAEVLEAIEAVDAAVGQNTARGPVNFERAANPYTLKVNRSGGIVNSTQRTIRLGETVPIQFDFTDLLNQETFTSMDEPTVDDANFTIEDYGINGIGNGGKGLNVILDCTDGDIQVDDEVELEVVGRAGSTVLRGSHTFKVVE